MVRMHRYECLSGKFFSMIFIGRQPRMMHRICQFFQKPTTKHAGPLKTIDLSWPIWGIDIVGLLPKAKGRYKYWFVGIDTFTKWMEAEPVVNIMQEVAVKFLKGNVCCFGVPRWIITNNGAQFKSKKFKWCCANNEAQTNGLVERAKDLILQGMKTRMRGKMEAKGRNWIEHLSAVLWSLRTNPSRAIHDTPFQLV